MTEDDVASLTSKKQSVQEQYRSARESKEFFEVKLAEIVNLEQQLIGQATAIDELLAAQTEDKDAEEQALKAVE